jgi:hypothetical protein
LLDAGAIPLVKGNVSCFDIHTSNYIYGTS